MHLRFERRNRLRVDVDDLVHDRRLVHAPEWGLTGQEFVQDDAEREDVRSMVRLLPLHLFRRHVADSAYRASFLR